MFIAVINENFQVAEEAKKGRQTEKYLESQQAHQGRFSWMRKLNPYRWMRANPVTIKVDNLPTNLVLPMNEALVQDYDASQSNNQVSGIPFIDFQPNGSYHL